MSSAYAYAEGGSLSPEIRLAQAIDRYGIMAVLGRPVLYLHEYYAMKTAEGLVSGYLSRQRSQNWAAWQLEYPDMAKLLFDAERLLNANRRD